MINFVVRSGTRQHTLDAFLEHPATAALDVRVVTIESLTTARHVQRGTWIFGDLDRYGTNEVRLASQVATAVQAADPEARVLNDPAVVPGRHALLDRLHAKGHNDFRAHRLDELDRVERWPVFLRMAREHYSPDQTLHHDRSSVEEARKRLPNRHLRPDDEYLLVEFVDTQRSDGRWAKYSTYRIGDRIVHEHLSYGADWFVKYTPLTCADDIAHELTWIRGQEHAADLRAVFDLAQVEFGRVDYALRDGRIQTWEINTNPVLSEPATDHGPRIHENRELAIRLLADAFALIDDPRPPVELRVEGITPELRLLALRDAAAYKARFGLSRAIRRRLRGTTRRTARPH